MISQNYKTEFIEFLMEAGVLKFGNFIAKSGRKLPYFINAGDIKTGKQIERLGEFYAQCYLDKIGDKQTVLFGPAYKEQLGYLGTRSGRDEDKVAKVGLTPVFSDGTTYFKEANLVLICKKLYRAPILEEGFIDKSIVDDCYPDKDFHDMYIGSIEKVLIAE